MAIWSVTNVTALVTNSRRRDIPVGPLGSQRQSPRVMRPLFSGTGVGSSGRTPNWPSASVDPMAAQLLASGMLLVPVRPLAQPASFSVIVSPLEVAAGAGAFGRNALKPSSRHDQRSSVCSRPGSATMATVCRL